jgi:membrane protein DedA with SNARE-associated domain
MTPETLYWVASIFLWLLFTGIGIPPVPEEAGILYAAGVGALHPEVPWWLAWPAAAAGIIGADMALYGVGRLLGRRVFQYRWVNHLLSPERRGRLESQFHRHGVKFLLMARLLPPLRTGIFIMAGSLRYSFALFLLADAAYGVVGVGLVFFFGTAIMAVIHRVGGWVVLVAAAAVGVYLLYRYYRYLKRLELKAAEKVATTVAETVAPEAVAPESEKQPVVR